jgi:hypothetical protein
MWLTLTCKRVDVVCRWNGILRIVEVKDVQSMSALGQVLTYTLLWNKEARPEGPGVPLVVCGRFDPELSDVYQQNHVEVVCV